MVELRGFCRGKLHVISSPDVGVWGLTSPVVLLLCSAVECRPMLTNQHIHLQHCRHTSGKCRDLIRQFRAKGSPGPTASTLGETFRAGLTARAHRQRTRGQADLDWTCRSSQRLCGRSQGRPGRSCRHVDVGNLSCIHHPSRAASAQCLCCRTERGWWAWHRLVSSLGV